MDILSGRQLQAGAEAVIRSGNRICGPGNEKTSDRQLLPKKNEEKYTFEKNIIHEIEKIFSESNHAIFRR